MCVCVRVRAEVKKEQEEGDEPRAETESESEEELSCFAPTVSHLLLVCLLSVLKSRNEVFKSLPPGSSGC